MPRVALIAAAAVGGLTFWRPTLGRAAARGPGAGRGALRAAPIRATELLAWTFLAAWLLRVWAPLSPGGWPRAVTVPALLYLAVAVTSWLALTIGGAAGIQPPRGPSSSSSRSPPTTWCGRAPSPKRGRCCRAPRALRVLLATIGLARSDRRVAPELARTVLLSVALLGFASLAEVVRQWGRNGYGGVVPASLRQRRTLQPAPGRPQCRGIAVRACRPHRRGPRDIRSRAAAPVASADRRSAAVALAVGVAHGRDRRGRRRRADHPAQGARAPLALHPASDRRRGGRPHRRRGRDGCRRRAKPGRPGRRPLACGCASTSTRRPGGCSPRRRSSASASGTTSIDPRSSCRRSCAASTATRTRTTTSRSSLRRSASSAAALHLADRCRRWSCAWRHIRVAPEGDGAIVGLFAGTRRIPDHLRHRPSAARARSGAAVLGRVRRAVREHRRRDTSPVRHILRRTGASLSPSLDSFWRPASVRR